MSMANQLARLHIILALSHFSLLAAPFHQFAKPANCFLNRFTLTNVHVDHRLSLDLGTMQQSQSSYHVDRSRWRGNKSIASVRRCTSTIDPVPRRNRAPLLCSMQPIGDWNRRRNPRENGPIRDYLTQKAARLPPAGNSALVWLRVLTPAITRATIALASEPMGPPHAHAPRGVLQCRPLIRFRERLIVSNPQGEIAPISRAIGAFNDSFDRPRCVPHRFNSLEPFVGMILAGDSAAP